MVLNFSIIIVRYRIRLRMNHFILLGTDTLTYLSQLVLYDYKKKIKYQSIYVSGDVEIHFTRYFVAFY